MPLETRNYKLEAFVWGDNYSSLADRRRFITIDNQLDFISSLVGDGVIGGWKFTDNGDGTISVSPGMGVIDKKVVQSFGSSNIILSNNTIHYIYAKAKNGEVGGRSGNSGVANVVGVNTIAPIPPTNLQQETSISDYLDGISSYDDDFVNYINKLLDRRYTDGIPTLSTYKEVAFSWDDSPEVDFDYFKVIRIDGSDSIVLGTTTEAFYADINLTQDSSYTYRVIAVDVSGNESVASEIVISTDVDTRIPSPPLYVELFPGDATLEVIWDHSPTGDVGSYEIEVQPLDVSYNPTGSMVSTTVIANSDLEFGSTYAIFDGLSNNTNYDITVYAVPLSGSAYKSEGVTARTYLQAMSGAGEVENVNVDFPISAFENIGIETHLTWDYVQNDPYLPVADKFLVTVIERGVRFSETIEILANSVRVGSTDSYSFEMKYIPYKLTKEDLKDEDKTLGRSVGDVEYESILEYTPYLFLIQTEDEEGNFSNGVMLRVNRTKISELLPAIANFKIERKTDNSIFLQWSNPQEAYFNYNLISISILDLGSGDVDGVPYIEDVRIGKSTTYTIPSDQFSVNYRYDITITAYDGFDTEGMSYSYSRQFTESAEVIRPPLPSNVQIQSGDTELYITWDMDNSEDQEIEYYKIYRADFTFYVRTTDFSNIATVPSQYGDFTDYNVDNNQVYTYFVTAVDIYGNESLNPVEDGYMPSGLVSANPTESLSLSPPVGLQVSVNSNDFDAELSWTATSGSFDGYEILRSDGNDYSFEVIGNVPASQTTYIDYDAILKDGERYYYLVRKYKNEVDIIATSSSALPYSSISIGIITTSNGTSNVSIDLSSVVDILNLEDPLTNKTNKALAIHHHTNTYGTDKRIELRSNIHVSNWSTNDYTIYSTTEDIEGGSNYFLTIEGTLNEEYFTSNGVVDVASLAQAQAGESPILYSINSDKGKIVFNSALFSSSGSFSAPYLDSPMLSLEVLGVSEVDNYLPPENVESISATQFSSGRLDIRQMPDVYHQGRKEERLLPLRLPLKTLDNFVYSMAATYDNEDRNVMGTAVTFYDVIEIDSDKLLSATSNGIWLSNNYGNDWDKVASFSSSVYRVYKSLAGEYYALTNYGVYKNNGTGFTSWNLMSGLEYVKVTRDITEDWSGNLYVTTDIGVFRLNSEDVPYIKDTWEKLSIFGPRSSEAYAIVYDGDYFDSSSNGRLMVSNEIGILQSSDEGRSWSYIPELESSVKIRKFLINGNYIFALSDFSVYREEIGTSSFVKIAETGANISRSFDIFGSTIYISTDEGALSSKSANIYTDTDIDLLPEFSLMNINNSATMVTSINNVGSHLFVGTDRRIYVLNEENEFWLQFRETGTVVPTFYVDGVLQKIGFYYSNGGTEQNVSFDEIIDHESVVEVSNKYDIYFAEYGGWAHNKYNAKFTIYNNHNKFGESRDSIEIDSAPFLAVTLPTYNDNNANKITADVYAADVISDIEQITAVSPLEGDELLTLISKTYKDFELFLSQIYEDARVVTDADGNTSNFVLPSIFTDIVVKRTTTTNLGVTTEVEEPVYQTINEDRGASYSTSVNVVNGMFVFDIPFDKYDNLTVDINDVTVKNVGEYGHREIEDVFEQIYSGPPSYLSQVQQANIVKMGMFSERNWPGQQRLYSEPLQMETFVPTDDTWYDTLNSTINYEVQNENSGLSLSLFYPSCVIFSSNTGSVLVGGIGGVLSIDPDTLDIVAINLGSIGGQMVRSIYEVDSIIYILTDSSVFLSSDGGVSWNEYNRSGLPNNLYSFGSINKNLIVGAEDGIYIKLSDSESISWEKVKDSTSPVTVMYSSNLLFVVVDGSIYITTNGFTYAETNVGEDLDITNITRYGFTNTYISTSQGLYSDNGTFNSINPKLEMVDLGELLDSTGIITVNDTVTNNVDKTVVGVSSGSYAIIQNDVLSIKDFTSLDSVHKVLFVNNDVWLFGQDVFKVPFLDYPIKLSTGAPM